MLYYSTDRGEGLGKLRSQEILTDVVLVSEGEEIHAHKLILSLHSFYFRTLFQSCGFSESDRDRINMSSLEHSILLCMIEYIYTGKLYLDPDLVMDLSDLEKEDIILALLQAETFLQLNDDDLRNELEQHLVSRLAGSPYCPRTVLRMGQYASIFQLATLQDSVFRILDVNLAYFLEDSSCLDVLCNLEYQDIQSILSRESLCIPCDSLLLNWIIAWAKRKLYNETNVIKLIQNLQLDRKFIQRKTEKNLDGSNLASKLVLSTRSERMCEKFYYLVEFKLNKSQIRNIEEFVDKGEKSNFYCFSFPGGNLNKISAICSTASLAGTCNANYFRPITQGSHIHFHHGKLIILGGLEDSTRDYSTSQHRHVRKDILEFDLAARTWLPPIMKNFVPSKHYKRASVECISAALNKAFVIFSGRNSENDEAILFIDQLDLGEEAFKSKTNVNFISNLPEWFQVPCAIKYDCQGYLYVCSTKVFGRLELETQTWEKLPPPIGDLGDTKVWMCGVADRIYLLAGKPQSGSPSLTNTIQMFDVETSRWRLVCNTGLRFTPTSFLLHSGLLFLAGWCPAKNNFLLSVHPDTGAVTELGSGVEGIMSRGVLLHSAEIQHLFSKLENFASLL